MSTKPKQSKPQKPITAKAKTAPATTTKPKNLAALLITREEGKSDGRVLAESVHSMVTGNATTAWRFTQGGGSRDLDINDSVAVFQAQAAKVQQGNMSDVEALLTAQTMVLDAIFNELARRAALNMGEHMGAMDTYMKLALKAQSQCRTTAEALAEIKAPRHVSFVKQANIAHNQQINQGEQPALTHGNTLIRSNELSGASHELLPDTRALQAKSRVNPPVEALAALHRATDSRGQGQERSKQPEAWEQV